MDTTKKFDGYAKDYTAGRPNYAEELISCMYEKSGISGTSVIADIGSGTGKFATHLLEKGSEVYCVEPNGDMRHTAEEELIKYKNFHSVSGGAEQTTLPDQFVDFITTAQAFHWFHVERFRQECERILKPNGKVFLIWNIRDERDVVNKELHQIYTKYCPDFQGFNGGIKKDDPRIVEFFKGQYEYVEFDNPLYLKKEKYLARSLSGSYSLQEGDSNFGEYIKEIENVFDRHSQNGILKIGNASVAYVGCIESQVFE